MPVATPEAVEVVSMVEADLAAVEADLAVEAVASTAAVDPAVVVDPTAAVVVANHSSSTRKRETSKG